MIKMIYTVMGLNNKLNKAEEKKIQWTQKQVL